MAEGGEKEPKPGEAGWEPDWLRDENKRLKQGSSQAAVRQRNQDRAELESLGVLTEETISTPRSGKQVFRDVLAAAKEIRGSR